MKKKVFKIIGIVVVVFLIIAIGACIYFPVTIRSPKEYVKDGDVELEKLLTKADIKKDREQLIDIVEKTHPIFLEGTPEKYKKAKDKFLIETDEDMKVEKFQISVSKYLSSIEDGHTSIRWMEKRYLKVNWRYIDDKLFLSDENNVPNNIKVTKINGVRVEKIIPLINELFPAENYVAQNLNNARYAKSEKVLNLAGVESSNGITLTVEDNGGEKSLPLDFYEPQGIKGKPYEISSKKIDDKTFYIKLGICDYTPDFRKVIEELKASVNSNIENVIVDVRDNPGGNSGVCEEILKTIKITPGKNGGIIRLSPLASERYGFLRKSGSFSNKPSNKVTKNENIKLYTIMNEKTFSSAQMLCTWVKDGGLGTLVGQPCSNMPSSFGDILMFQLNNSKIEGQISFKKFLRPDKNRNSERVLEPDVKVDYKDDALNKTLELIKAK